MCSQDKQKGEDWSGERETIEWDEGREGERERRMGTKRMVQVLIMASPDIDGNAGATCAHTLHNTLWSPALSKHCLVWQRVGDRKREREEEEEGKHMKEPEFKGQTHPVLHINKALAGRAEPLGHYRENHCYCMERIWIHVCFLLYYLRMF